ncbi:hypothetical protein [Dokdonia sp.]|uniref:hypothetical protein n=1 Tax=Dokdonia sp. TaxID=2024995 RepID=UPI0032657DD3
MKKAILLIIGCLAYVSVQAQQPTVTAEQIKKDVQAKVQAITLEVKFTDVQKELLTKLLIYNEESKTEILAEDSNANPIKNVDMNTYFTQEQRNAIYKHRMVVQQKTLSIAPTSSTNSSKSKF